MKNFITPTECSLLSVLAQIKDKNRRNKWYKKIKCRLSKYARKIYKKMNKIL